MRTLPLLIPSFLAAAGLFSQPTGALAQSADIVRATVGEYLIAPDNGRPGCRVQLESNRVTGGLTARPAADCGAKLPAAAGVALWELANGGLVLRDASRKVVLTFEEDETAIWKTRGDAVPNYYLVQPKAGVDRAPHSSAIFGRWAMQRPDGPAICTVTFLDKPPPGGEESFALAVDPSCDAAVKRLKLANWRIEDFTLQLYGLDGSTLTFDPSLRGFEKSAADKGKPLWLVRQK